MFTLLLASFIFLTGCDDSGPTGSAVETVCNTPYFEYRVGECCVDKNANSICDSDETIVEETPTETVEEVVEEVVVKEPVEEVEITVEDACTDTTYFECIASYITKDEVFLKLKTRRDGYLHLRKISALGCLQEFAPKERANQGYQIRSDLVLSSRCLNPLISGTEIKDADYVLEYVFYPDDAFLNQITGEWEGQERSLQKSTGKISATIRNEPKKIL